MHPLPELDWLDISLLQIDFAYQRNAEGKASIRLVNAIARDFDWCKFQPITVCRAGEAYHVIDGQHRLLALRKRGDIPKAPCYIIAAGSTTEEAQAFMGLNRNRVRLHTIDIFHASLAAGNETAQLVDSVCREAGITICKYPFSHAMMPPGHIQAVATLEQAVERYSKNSILRALKTLHAAFPDVPGQMRRSVLSALLRLYADNLGKGKRIDDTRLAGVIRMNKPQRMESSARMDESFHGGTVAWIVAFLTGEYNKGLGQELRIGGAA